jgi:hypothetical protein
MQGIDAQPQLGSWANAAQWAERATEARAISTLISLSLFAERLSLVWILEGSRRGDCSLFQPQVLYFLVYSRPQEAIVIIVPENKETKGPLLMLLPSQLTLR